MKAFLSWNDKNLYKQELRFFDCVFIMFCSTLMQRNLYLNKVNDEYFLNLSKIIFNTEELVIHLLWELQCTWLRKFNMNSFLEKYNIENSRYFRILDPYTYSYIK